jgi:hypothetical protein
MSKKQQPDNIQNITEEPGSTTALDTLHPGSRPAEGLSQSNDMTKSELLRKIIAVSGTIEKGDLSKFLDSLQQIGHEADKLPGGATKDHNEASIKGKKGLGVAGSMKEDVASIFGGVEGLSEEFVDNATGLFEAALEARLVVEEARLQEEYDQKLEEAYGEMAEDLTAKVDEYLDYVVDHWMAENAVAIEKSMRVEVMESFIDGMKNLFKEHYIDIPEEKVDVVGELSAKVEELEARLSDSIAESIDLRAQAKEAQRKSVVDSVVEGLVLSQADKLRTLAEGFDFADEASFRQRLELVKESYFSGNKPRSTTQLVTEEIIHDEAGNLADPLATDPTQKPTNGQMGRYVSAISRNVKKH